MALLFTTLGIGFTGDDKRLRRGQQVMIKVWKGALQVMTKGVTRI